MKGTIKKVLSITLAGLMVMGVVVMLITQLMYI